ncbi:MAG TPA: Rrf2 family transcriptional regulator [Spirochaetota bacterium]|nr:Rrf2 family transcriptional regulator [Spirochaetota bacterium]HPJ34316.1 Rrf2 family transcriptional regulator [Spirochaetota bacterium]
MSGLFHFSEAISLALHAMELMARERNTIFTARTLATRLNASEAHLAKVFQRLVKTDLVISHRGPNGGFRLKREPEEITLLEIFTAIEGNIRADVCPMIKDTCPFSQCIFSGIMFKFQNEFLEFITKNRLSDFILQ